jgi:hypothetical protein
MIMWITQLICCGIHMKSEILVDHAAPGAGAACQPAHGHHGPLEAQAAKRRSSVARLFAPLTMTSPAVAGLPPGAGRLIRAAEAYLDVSLANRGVKALSLEARSDPTLRDSMADRRERLAAAGVTDLKAMGWDDAEAAAQLLAAMTREISVLEFDAGSRLPASRRALQRFLGT